ncbi:MAG: hypothetical protein D6723_15675 [Acidobacteria bacterium]|nr:MAG: hypothetical protein D6723_15675 [Acidobacteriota bacterium]
MKESRVTRRRFLKGSGLATLGLMLNYAPHSLADLNIKPFGPYRRFEDLYRQKWTWDKVVHGTHGTNCAGACALNIYVKNGLVWREEQQAEYGASGDAPDYNPRGCQKGLCHSSYMYGKQRVLYPMKRVGKRGEGKWMRISWEQACREIADKFIDISIAYGPDAISTGSGTQMVIKYATLAAFSRFAAITGVSVPEFYSGVGDLPTGAYMTLGTPTIGDTIASVFKARTLIIWATNPAVTRLPDAHFFWEAKYNGATVVAISPEFNATAMHASKWVNPKPGTDLALALAMIHLILKEKWYQPTYITEQTDLPLLVRKDTRRFLRQTDFIKGGDENVFYLWDEATSRPVPAPATGSPVLDRAQHSSLALGHIRPALEGSWTVWTLDGEVEVTTVFEFLKQKMAQYTPQWAAQVTGLHPDVIHHITRELATVKPALIYTGYQPCKWLHGDLLHRAMLLILSLTGNIGYEGSGLQILNSLDPRSLFEFAFSGIGPSLRMLSGTTWDYEKGHMKELNEKIYGRELAETIDFYYQKSIREGWFPSYGNKGWKMGIFAGNGGPGWRASANHWRATGFDQLDTIVALVPDMGFAAHHADYVLPIAHHYERADLMFHARLPYVQVLDAAVRPLGEAVDDWTAMYRLLEAVSQRARERGIPPIEDEVNGRKFKRDFTQYLDLYTMNGRIKSIKDVAQFLLDRTPGVPKVSFDELAARGIIRVHGSESTMWQSHQSPYHTDIPDSVVHKRPYNTMTRRQQFYFDQDWFLKFDEALPSYKSPLRLGGYPLRLIMGHARHGVHTMWRDHPLLLQLQRGEPDIYLSLRDANQRGIRDGDRVRVFNPAGQFFARARVSPGIQPGMLFMYHGWDPMMFPNRQNFSAVICTAGLIKPTSMVGGYGHLGHRLLQFAPNQTYRDFTVEVERYEKDS